MPTLQNKIDFILTIDVDNANPNGDPLSGNMPRTDANGYGLISDVAIKRKLRNRLQDLNQAIFVQANHRIDDEFRSLQKRFESYFDKKDTDQEVAEKSCQYWMDVRSFGQVITYQNRSTRTCIDHYGEIRRTDRRIEHANHTQHKRHGSEKRRRSLVRHNGYETLRRTRYLCH